MTNAEKLTLAKHACHIRMGVIEGTHSAKCGHPGGSLDIAEVLSYLYFVDMSIDPKEPKKPGPRPLRAVQGPCSSGTLRHAGRARVLPGGRPQDPAQDRQLPAGPPQT